VRCHGEHVFSECDILYFTYPIGLCVRLLQILILKVITIDIIMHRVRNYFSLCFVKHWSHFKTFRITLVGFDNIYSNGDIQTKKNQVRSSADYRSHRSTQFPFRTYIPWGYRTHAPNPPLLVGLTSVREEGGCNIIMHRVRNYFSLCFVKQWSHFKTFRITLAGFDCIYISWYITLWFVAVRGKFENFQCRHLAK
jgi:hypothetical protein